MTNGPFELREDGTIRIDLESGSANLKRATVGQLKELKRLSKTRDESISEWREQLRATQAELLDLRAQLQAVEAEPDDNDDNSERVKALREQADEVVARQRAQSVDFQERLEGITFDWWERAFAMLSDRPLPSSRDDWPAFLTDVSSMTQTIMHLSTIPLVRGGSQPPQQTTT